MEKNGATQIMEKSRATDIVFYAHPVLTEPQRMKILGYLESMIDRGIIGSKIPIYERVQWDEMESAFGEGFPLHDIVMEAQRTGEGVPLNDPQTSYTVIGPIKMIYLAQADEEAKRMDERFRLKHIFS